MLDDIKMFIVFVCVYCLMLIIEGEMKMTKE